MTPALQMRIYGFPVPQGRPRLAVIAGHARAYDPEKSRDWKRTVHHEASMSISTNPRFPLQGPLDVAMIFCLLRPMTLPKKITRHTKRPDLDNLAKAVMDAISGCIYRDDAQIVSLHISKIYDERPGVLLTITELEAP